MREWKNRENFFSSMTYGHLVRLEANPTVNYRKTQIYLIFQYDIGGESGIRTHGTVGRPL